MALGGHRGDNEVAVPIGVTIGVQWVPHCRAGGTVSVLIPSLGSSPYGGLKTIPE